MAEANATPSVWSSRASVRAPGPGIAVVSMYAKEQIGTAKADHTAAEGRAAGGDRGSRACPLRRLGFVVNSYP